MAALDELPGAIAEVVDGVRSLSDDPAEQIRLLAKLAAFDEVGSTGPGRVGQGIAAAQAAVAALCRRMALIAMARAAAESSPPSYDEAVALRSLVCGMLDAEVTRAGDTGQDATATELRLLRAAVARDLTERAANLARMRTVALPSSLPALVLAHRLYADIARADELAGYAAAPDPNFMPTTFVARGR